MKHAEKSTFGKEIVLSLGIFCLINLLKYMKTQLK